MGQLNVNEASLHQGDSIILDNNSQILSVDETCTLVCFEIDKNSKFTRNGMYSGMKR
jgi:quercetin 2,3-dioxygenase